jgi:hypothetical protein
MVKVVVVGMDSRLLTTLHVCRCRYKTNLAFLKHLSLYYGITPWQSSSQSRVLRKTSRSDSSFP